jgi:hypothetical protein
MFWAKTLRGRAWADSVPARTETSAPVGTAPARVLIGIQDDGHTVTGVMDVDEAVDLYRGLGIAIRDAGGEVPK